MALAPGPPRRRRPGGPVSRPAGRPTLLGARRPAPRRPQRTRARAAGRRAPCLLGRAGAARRLARACGGHRRPRSRWGGWGRHPARASAPARPVAAAAREHPAGPPGHAQPGGQQPRGAPHATRARAGPAGRRLETEAPSRSRAVPGDLQAYGTQTPQADARGEGPEPRAACLLA